MKMTFESSNTEWIENLSDVDLIENIRLAMKEECIIVWIEKK